MINDKNLAKKINNLAAHDVAASINDLVDYLEANLIVELRDKLDSELPELKYRAKFLKELRDLPQRIKDSLEDSRING